MVIDVLTAIKERQSIRAFTKQPVPRATIESILEVARFAPSGTNTQPWKVTVVAGARKQALSEAIVTAREQGIAENPDYQYYPLEWRDPYKARRFACGMALYSALGIERHHKQRRAEVWELNYYFFHAPVGLIFSIDNFLDKGSWVDMGMFIQNVMLAARGHGLETCPQASIAEYPDIVREHLLIPTTQHIICGLAMGYADSTQAINHYRTERESVANFTQWIWE